jgi:dihydrofolate reductase
MLFNVPEIRVVVLTVRACETSIVRALSSRPWITPVVMDEPRELPHAFLRLREMGLERISCIGGRTLATQLLDARLVRDVYLTTSARDGGEPNTPVHPKPLNAELVVGKMGTGVETGVVFEHLRMTSA